MMPNGDFLSHTHTHGDFVCYYGSLLKDTKSSIDWHVLLIQHREIPPEYMADFSLKQWIE